MPETSKTAKQPADKKIARKPQGSKAPKPPHPQACKAPKPPPAKIRSFSLSKEMLSEGWVLEGPEVGREACRTYTTPDGAITDVYCVVVAYLPASSEETSHKLTLSLS